MPKELTPEEHIAQIHAEQELNHETKAALKAAGFKVLQFKGATVPVLMRCKHEHQHTVTPLSAVKDGCQTCNEMKVAIPVSKAEFIADVKVQNDTLYRGYKRSRRPNARSNAPCERYTL